MRIIRAFVGVMLVAALAMVAGSSAQDKDKAGPERPRPKAQLPRDWDKLGLTDAQRTEILKVTADSQERRAKLQEEIRKLDEELARKRVALLTDDQRKKLIDLVAGPPPKDKADPKAKSKDK